MKLQCVCINATQSSQTGFHFKNVDHYGLDTDRLETEFFLCNPNSFTNLPLVKYSECFEQY